MIIILRDYNSEDEYGRTMRDFDKVVRERGKVKVFDSVASARGYVRNIYERSDYETIFYDEEVAFAFGDDTERFKYKYIDLNDPKMIRK